MINVYATPHQVKEFLLSQNVLDNQISRVNPKDEQLIKRFCISASRRFDAECKRRFYPMIETKIFDHPQDDTCLQLYDDLLGVSVFTTQNGGVSVTSDQYYLMTGHTYNEPPYDRLVMKSDGGRPNLLYSGTTQRANSVTGFWGYHERWSDAWLNSGDTVEDDPLSAAATTITVNDSNGEDYYGFTPRFQEYQLIKIDSEYLFITAVDNENNTLTVKRGVNGTTAAAHVQNTQIDIYQPMEEIQDALTFFATHSYRRKDAVGSPTDRALTTPQGIFVMPAKLPEEVWSMIKTYKSLI